MTGIPPNITEPFLRLAVEKGYLDAETAKKLSAGGTGISDLDDLDIALQCIREELLDTTQVIEIRKSLGRSPVKQFGMFEILGPIGKGGMGVVYKARRVDTGLIVALKVLPRWLANDEISVERFMREAKILGSINHPNVVKAIDAGKTEDRYYLAMEYLDGGTLRDRVKKRGPLGEREALKVTRAIARALRETSRIGIIHRDVKPQNILFNSEGVPKLADLGLADRQGEHPGKKRRGIIGTPNYFSPEQALRKNDLDIRSDIYSLGTTIYYAVTGKPPFSGSDPRVLILAHLKHTPPDPRSAAPGISKRFAHLILRMLEKDPAKRPQTPQEIIGETDRMLSPPIFFAASAERFLFLAWFLIVLASIIAGAWMLASRRNWHPAHKQANETPAALEPPAEHLDSVTATPANAAELIALDTPQPKPEPAVLEPAHKPEPAAPVKKEQETAAAHLPPPEPQPKQDTQSTPEYATAPTGIPEQYVRLVEALTPLLAQRRYKDALDRLRRLLASTALAPDVRTHVAWEYSLIHNLKDIFDDLARSFTVDAGTEVAFEMSNGIRGSGKVARVDATAGTVELEGGGSFALRALSTEYILSRLHLREGGAVTRMLAVKLLLADGMTSEAVRESKRAREAGADTVMLDERIALARKIRDKFAAEKAAAEARQKETATEILFQKAEKAFTAEQWPEAAAAFRKLIAGYADTGFAQRNKETIQDHFVHAARRALDIRGIICAEKTDGGKDTPPTYTWYFEHRADEEMSDFDYNPKRWRARKGALEHYGIEMSKWPIATRTPFTRIEEVRINYKATCLGRLGISFNGCSFVFLFAADEVVVYRGGLDEYQRHIPKDLPEKPDAQGRTDPQRRHAITIRRVRDRYRVLLDDSFMEDAGAPDENVSAPIVIRDTQRCRIYDISVTGIIDPEWAAKERARLEDEIARAAEY